MFWITTKSFPFKGEIFLFHENYFFFPSQTAWAVFKQTKINNILIDDMFITPGLTHFTVNKILTFT